MEILSYQNDPALKSRFLAHVERHRGEDRVLQGTYGALIDGEWKGCAVGCALRSLDEIDGKTGRFSFNEHAELAERLGIPLVLTYLQDQIFEGLPAADAKKWPTRFAKAIPVGRDMAMVWPQLATWLLIDDESGVLRFVNTEATKQSILRVAALYERHLAGNTPSSEEWRSAAAASYAAARYAAARYAAADAAAAAADARYAARYAAAAADAAARYAAADAAADAARSDYYRRMASKLCELMRGVR